MSGREQIPPSQDSEDAPLAVSVLAEHLRWCATGLASSTLATAGGRLPDDLAGTVEALADGQRKIAVTLHHLAKRIGLVAPSVDGLALSEVLRASAAAAGHTADALAEAGPLMEAPARDTHL